MALPEHEPSITQRYPDASPPPPSTAPTLVYDPGTQQTKEVSGGEIATTIAGIVAGGPVGGFLNVVGRLFGGTEGNEPWLGLPVVASSESGKVTMPSTKVGGAYNKLFAEYDRKKQLPILQETFDTGIVQAGLLPYYSSFADQLAAFRVNLDLQAGSEAAPGFTKTQPPPGDRGETVPGFEPPSNDLPTLGFPGFGTDDRGGPIGGPELNRPVDLRNLFMPTNPYMPFSGLPSPRGGGGGTSRRRRKKKVRSGTRRKRAKSGGKKLKFGSRAYRQKYLGHK